ncbi:MAG: PP2C family protein-serine/threonine phosphatase [Candidatus Baltobacteraceae bacterium]
MLRSAGTLTAATILILALAIAVLGGFNTRRAVNASFAEQNSIERGQLALERLLRLQLDEQNYIRAYVITQDPSYIDSYKGTGAAFVQERAQLQSVLQAEHLQDARAALLGYDSAHADWQRRIADPLLRNPNGAPASMEMRSKSLVDLQSQAAHFIEARMDAKNREVLDATQARINATIVTGIVALIAFGLVAILFYGWRYRLNTALESERVTTQTLQRAFRSEHVPLPNCAIGSAYGAASSRLAVGGDVFDVHRLSDRLGLILIADVSGKGVDAAVLTAFIKFTIRGIALRRRQPASILQEFNRAFPSTVANPQMFVSMFVGILDTWSLRLDYASGGHDIAFMRRADVVEQLAVTGPILGVMEEPFESRTMYLEHGDTIVLSTDGLTESRDEKGALLEAAGAMEWIRSAPEDPAELASYLIEHARTRSAQKMRDDVAVLAIRIARPSDIPAPRPEKVQASA